MRAHLIAVPPGAGDLRRNGPAADRVRAATYSEVMHARRFTRTARDEIRRCAVYCIKVFGDDPETLIVLHRDYQTLDAPERVADYPSAVASHFRRSDLDLTPDVLIPHGTRAPDPRDLPCVTGYADERRTVHAVWLFNDGSRPYRNRECLAAYRDLITRIFGLDGLRRIAALCGRELGPWPVRGVR